VSDEEQPAPPAQEPTVAGVFAKQLEMICRGIINQFEIDGVAIGIVTTDGRLAVHALSVAEHSDRITAEMLRGLKAIAAGDEVVCIGCAGKKTINGYACFGCGGTGVERSKED
jgi:Asp/Glu/hydantoin racemase